MYRDCQHECIQQYHNLLLEIYISHLVNHRFFETCMRFTREEVPPSIAKTLILRHAPHEMVSSEFASIAAWRVHFNDPNDNSPRYLPSRIGVISSAAKTDLSLMLTQLYTHLARNVHAQDPHSTNVAFQSALARTHADAMTNNMSIAIRQLNTPHISVSGLQEVLRSIRASIDTTFTLLEQNNDTDTAPHILDEDWTSTIGVSGHTESGYAPTLYNILSQDGQQDIRANGQHYAMDRLTAYCNYILPANAQVYAMSYLGHARTPVNTYAPPDSPSPSRANTYPRNRSPIFSVQLVTNTHANVAADSITSSQCTICWDPLEADTACVSDCNHSFCTSCMVQHVRSTRTRATNDLRYTSYRTASTNTHLVCPMCRHNIADLVYFSESDAAMSNILEMRIMLDAANTAAAAQPAPIENPIENAFQGLLDMLDDPNAVPHHTAMAT